MKCFHFGFLLLVCVLVCMPIGVFAQVDSPIEPESAIGASGGVPDLDFGVDGYPDSVSVVGVIPTTASEYYEEVASGTITVLSYSFYGTDMLASGHDPILCDDVGVSGDYFNQQIFQLIGLSSRAPLHCSESFGFSTYEEVEGYLYYAVQYVPYDTRLADKSNKDIVFGLGIIITLMFIATSAFVFNKIKRRKPWLR